MVTYFTHSCIFWGTIYIYLNRVAAVLFFLIYLFYLHLCLAALGVHCCTRAFSSCGEQGLLFVVVRGLLIEAASLVAEHGL